MPTGAELDEVRKQSDLSVAPGNNFLRILEQLWNVVYDSKRHYKFLLGVFALGLLLGLFNDYLAIFGKDSILDEFLEFG